MDRTRTSARRYAALSLLALLVLLLALLLRGATQPTSAEAANLKLANAEKAALDVLRVRSFYDSIGLRVAIRFRGNVTRLLGTGKLRRAAIAVVPMPKEGQVADAAVLTTEKGQLVLHGTGEAKRVAIDARGNLLRFFLPGVDPEDMRGAMVKTLVRAPKGTKGVIHAADCAGEPPEERAAAADLGSDAPRNVGTSGDCGGDRTYVGFETVPPTPTDTCERFREGIAAFNMTIASLDPDMVSTSGPQRGTVIRAQNADIRDSLIQKRDAAQAQYQSFVAMGACPPQR